MSKHEDRNEGPLNEDDGCDPPEGPDDLAEGFYVAGPEGMAGGDALEPLDVIDMATPDGGEGINAAFFHEVMSDLADTNFARGWNDPEMYQDFLTWCESSEGAEAIISRFSPSIPSVLVDPDENVRLVGLEARIAAELMRALLEAYEGERIEEFLNR